MKKVHIKQCRYCGGTEFVNAPTSFAVQNHTYTLLLPPRIYHTVCVDCGSILRSFVYQPERLLTSRCRKQRKLSKEG